MDSDVVVSPETPQQLEAPPQIGREQDKQEREAPPQFGREQDTDVEHAGTSATKPGVMQCNGLENGKEMHTVGNYCHADDICDTITKSLKDHMTSTIDCSLLKLVPLITKELEKLESRLVQGLDKAAAFKSIAALSKTPTSVPSLSRQISPSTSPRQSDEREVWRPDGFGLSYRPKVKRGKPSSTNDRPCYNSEPFMSPPQTDNTRVMPPVDEPCLLKPSAKDTEHASEKASSYLKPLGSANKLAPIPKRKMSASSILSGVSAHSTQVDRISFTSEGRQQHTSLEMLQKAQDKNLLSARRRSTGSERRHSDLESFHSSSVVPPMSTSSGSTSPRSPSNLVAEKLYLPAAIPNPEAHDDNADDGNMLDLDDEEKSEDSEKNEQDDILSEGRTSGVGPLRNFVGLRAAPPSASSTIGPLVGSQPESVTSSMHFSHGASHASHMNSANTVNSCSLAYHHLSSSTNSSAFFNREDSIVARRNSLSLNSMRQHRQNELLEQALASQRLKGALSKRLSGDSDSEEIYDPRFCTPLWLCLVGIVNWPSEGMSIMRRWTTYLNRVITLLLMTASWIYYGHWFATKQAPSESCDIGLCVQDAMSSILALGIGCFIRLISFWFTNDQVIGTDGAALTVYAASTEGLRCTWFEKSRRDLTKMLLCWCCTFGIVVYSSFSWRLDTWVTVMHLAVCAFILNIYMAFAYSLLHLCRGLLLTLDHFVLHIQKEQQLADACDDWNMLQSLFRSVCIAVARSYILLLTCSFAAVFLPFVFAESWFAVLPGACSLVVILWISLVIGECTSKCDRVPAYLNTLDFGKKFDHKRMYVVEYIMNSRAGFYMFEVRVTAEMVVKCSYVCFVVAAAFTTRLLSA